MQFGILYWSFSALRQICLIYEYLLSAQKLFFWEIIAQLELYFIRFFLKAFIEVFLVEIIIGIKWIFFVFYVWTLIIDFCLFIILRFQMFFNKSTLSTIFLRILFSISTQINFGKALVFIVKINSRPILFMHE